MPTVNPAPALCHRAPAGGAPSFHLCHISISHDIQNSLPPLAHGISCGLLGRPVALRTGPRRMGGRPRLRDRRPNHCGRPNHCSQRLHGVHRSRTARPVAAKLRRLGPNAGADGWQAGQGHLRGPVPPPRQWRMQRADGQPVDAYYYNLSGQALKDKRASCETGTASIKAGQWSNGQ